MNHKFQGWTRQKLIERIDSLEKQAIHPKLNNNKENNDLNKKYGKLQNAVAALEKDNLSLQQDKTNLESKFKELYSDFEDFKEKNQINAQQEEYKLNEKIQEIHKLQMQLQKNENGTSNVVDDLQNRLNNVQKELDVSKLEIVNTRNANKDELNNLTFQLSNAKETIMELESQNKELQHFNVHELDDSIEMLEIPNGTETTTLYSELEDQRLDLSLKYNKLLRQYRYLRSQQSLYSMKSNEQVYELEHKLLSQTAMINELKLVKINEMMVFKNDVLPNGEMNYLSSGYGHKHELLNRTLHKQVNDLINENKELRMRHLGSLKNAKSLSDKMQDLMTANVPNTQQSPSKRAKLDNEPQEQSECKTQ